MNIPFVDLSRIHDPLKKDFQRAFTTCFETHGFILGNDVDRFEDAFARFSGASFGIGTANGTDALLLGLKALGIKPGDEVILPSHTFIATALAITYAGGTPVFAEIQEDTYLIDPKQIEQHITKKTKCILPVCLYGQPVDFTQLSQVAKQYHLNLLVDDCQAHGATYKAKPMGHFGDLQAFSFYPGKNLGAFGDGGMVTTNKKMLEKSVRLLRNIGRTGWYEHPIKGYNSRLDTIQAAVLSIKLKHLQQWNKERQKAAKLYDELLDGLPLVPPHTGPEREHVFHLYVIRVKKRKEFLSFLEDHGVHASVHYPIPIHQQKAYKEYATVKLPTTEKVAKEVVSLPFFVGITPKEQEYVAATIRKYYRYSQ